VHESYLASFNSLAWVTSRSCTNINKLVSKSHTANISPTLCI
jgi:hypothetical protein